MVDARPLHKTRAAGGRTGGRYDGRMIAAARPAPAAPPSSMRAAELTADRTMRLAERPAPRAADGWTVLRVEAAGVCGTELHFLDGLLDPRGAPRVLGHEAAGVVCEAPGRPEMLGMRAAVYNVVNCGSCRLCRTGRDRLCERPGGMIGFTVDGGFAEYLLAPEANLVPLPPSVPPEDGAVLACSGMSAVHAVRLSGVGLGGAAVVNGIGGVGLMLIQAAVQAGASAAAVGDDPAKLELAESLGARAVLCARTPEDYAALEEEVCGLLGRRPDVFFETVGTRETMRAGLRCLAPGGAFVQIGYTAQAYDFHPSDLIKNELRILSSAAGSKQDLETALSLAAEGRLKTVIAGRSGLDGLENAIDRLRSRRVLGRNVITPQP